MDNPETKAINVYIFLPKTTSLLVMISIYYSAVIQTDLRLTPVTFCTTSNM